jgi:hypothetical protein
MVTTAVSKTADWGSIPWSPAHASVGFTRALVLHGHGHAGRFRRALGSVPVYNVSVPVMAQDFWVFELSGLERATTPLR